MLFTVFFVYCISLLDIWFQDVVLLLQSDPDYPRQISERWFRCDPADGMEMDYDSEQVPTVFPEYEGDPSSRNVPVLSALTIMVIVLIHQFY